MSNIKLCPRCGGLFFIDEWDGWRWSCMHCSYIGDRATDEEIDEQKKELWGDEKCSKK